MLEGANLGSLFERFLFPVRTIINLVRTKDSGNQAIKMSLIPVRTIIIPVRTIIGMGFANSNTYS